MRRSQQCYILDCIRLGNRGGLCSKHYQRWKKHGDPTKVSRKGSAPVLERFDLAIEKTDSCWLWRGPFNRAGYGKTRYKQAHITAHRLSWLLFRGAIPDGQWVLHKCDNPKCVNPDHLFLGNAQANVDDMIDKGRKVVATGERHGNAKLTKQMVQEIRTSTDTNAKLARALGLAPSCISKVRNGRAWRSIA